MKLFEFKPKLVSCLKNYSKETFMADLMAGIIVGIVALPLAIAFGIASGVSPEKGIITAIIAGFIISLLGGSKVQIGGPTGAFIVIIYGIIQQYGEAGLIVATLMAGVLLVVLGVFKLGAVIKFIPYPIIVGFTSGIAVTIFTTQIADIFGLSFGDEKVPGDFVGKWLIYFRHFDTINWWNTIVSIVSIIIIAITPKFSKKIPGSLSQLGKVYNSIRSPLLIGIDRCFRSHKSDICLTGYYGSHCLIRSKTGHKCQIQPLIFKISLFDCHILWCIKD